jgi:hypothetical protein
MQQGQLTPSHQDHPANRTCSSCSSSRAQRGGWQQQLHTAAQLAGWQQQAVAQQGFAAQLWGGSVDSSMEIDSVEGSLDEDTAAATATAAAAVASGGGAGGGGASSRRGARNGRSGSSSSALVDYSFHTSDLQLGSSYHMAHGRCVGS